MFIVVTVVVVGENKGEKRELESPGCDLCGRGAKCRENLEKLSLKVLGKTLRH